MARLILLRHFKSQWNLENRFTGWVDVPLCKDSREIIQEVASKLSGTSIDAIYTSPLIRNVASVLAVFEKRKERTIFFHFGGKIKKWGNFVFAEDKTGADAESSKNYVPVHVTEALNERYYGKLQGLNKEETIKKYGKELVHLWRRSFRKAPPGGESLAEVVKRTMPFYQKHIEKDLKSGKNILVVASHNSLRALIKHIEKISDEDIIHIEVPYAGLLEYEFTDGAYKKI